MALTLRFHEGLISVCKLAPDIAVPIDVLNNSFAAFLRVPGETTLICPAHLVPENVKVVEGGWVALELVGAFDFSLTGILTQVSVPLAEASIPIYVLSTFDTDYILIKADKRDTAERTLTAVGHRFI